MFMEGEIYIYFLIFNCSAHKHSTFKSALKSALKWGVLMFGSEIGSWGTIENVEVQKDKQTEGNC